MSSFIFRHSFTIHLKHLLDDGYYIRIIRKLLGHMDASTTKIYTNALKKEKTTAVHSHRIGI
ncbi:MAG: tyrosine-type recombinase/integrase [Desulfobacterales bacterium]|nr:tyrosine-type recombinase/integrase [Desulfobacterales bacterium]